MAREHIVGEITAAQRREQLHEYVVALTKLLAQHKLAIHICGMKARDHVKEQDPINMVYLALVDLEMATHCTGVSQVTGQLALMAAMGVDDLPRPEVAPEEPRPEDELN